jgi:hypothetical protein
MQKTYHVSQIKITEEEDTGVEQVFERMVKGMRNEMNTVLWKIERSRNVSPEYGQNRSGCYGGGS